MNTKIIILPTHIQKCHIHIQLLDIWCFLEYFQVECLNISEVLTMSNQTMQYLLLKNKVGTHIHVNKTYFSHLKSDSEFYMSAIVIYKLFISFPLNPTSKDLDYTLPFRQMQIKPLKYLIYTSQWTFLFKTNPINNLCNEKNISKNVSTEHRHGWLNKNKQISLHFDEPICDLNTYEHEPFYSALHKEKKSFEFCLCKIRFCSVCITFQKDKSALIKHSLEPVDFTTTSFREVSVISFAFICEAERWWFEDRSPCSEGKNQSGRVVQQDK